MLNASDGVSFVKSVIKKDVSDQHVRNILKSKGLTAHKKIKAPEISSKNIKLCKKFYHEHKGKTFDEFKNFIYTDESTFSVKSVSGGDWYYRCIDNKIPSQAVIRTKKFKRGKLMIWGMILFNGKFKIYRVDGMMNSNNYIDLLEKHVIEDIVEMGFKLSDVSFMQDNASCHKSKRTLQWFKDHNLTLLDWPPQSPDMNPIENLWKYLDTQVRMRQHEIFNVDDLWKILLEEAEKINKDIVKKLFKSIPKRINSLKNSNFDFTKY